jgi:hypothetical protein
VTADRHRGNPADTPLVDVVDDLDRAGFEGQFRAVAGASVECLTCHTVTAAAAIVADDVTRLEGASDPADEMLVVPVRCPACGRAGTLVLGYGPDSSAEDSDVVLALRRTPG